MISAYGECVSHGFDDYVDKYTNYTLAFEQGLVLPDARLNASARLSERQFWQFKAGDVAYCSADDMPCQRCIAQHFFSDLSYADSRFCEGEDGCVCIFNCEFRCGTFAPASASPVLISTYETRTPYPDPTTAPPPYSTDSGNSAEPNAALYAIGPLLVFTCMVLRWSGLRETRRAGRIDFPPAYEPPISPTASEPTSPPRREPPVNVRTTTSAPPEPEAQADRPAQLELYGWISHRQNIIDTKQRRLNGYEDVILWTRFQTPTQSNAM